MPKKHVYSNEALIEALRDYARWLGRTPTYSEVEAAQGMPSAQTFRNRFGSWQAALEAAGMQSGQPVIVSREEIVAAFQRIAGQLGRLPRESEWPYPPTLVRRHFATLHELRLATGVADGGASDGEKQLLQWVADFIEERGYAPKMDELPIPAGEIKRRYGSYTNLLAQLYLSANGGEERTALPSAPLRARPATNDPWKSPKGEGSVERTGLAAG